MALKNCQLENFENRDFRLVAWRATAGAASAIECRGTSARAVARSVARRLLLAGSAKDAVRERYRATSRANDPFVGAESASRT